MPRPTQATALTIAALLLVGLLATSSCGWLLAAASSCSDDGDCAPGEICRAGSCVLRTQPGTDGGHGDAAFADGARPDAEGRDAATGDAAVQEDAGVLSIEEFYADPNQVEYGQDITLRWRSSGATTCLLDSIAVSPSGERALENIRAAHTYVLECENTAETRVAEAPVTITCNSGPSLTAPAGTVTSEGELELLFGAATGCFTIDGVLIIQDSDLEDMRALDGLVEIRGSLLVRRNAALTSLAGLESLQEVKQTGGEEGHLEIGRWYESENQGNLLLTSIDGLSGLRHVGGYLHIEFNGPFPDVGGLRELRTVGWSIALANNTAVTDLQGLGRLHTVGRNFRLTHLDALRSLDGLASLTSVGWFLRLEHLGVLTNIDALATLQRVSWLAVLDTPQLDTLEPLQNLVAPISRLQLEQSGLADLESLRGKLNWQMEFIYLGHNQHLAQIEALVGVTAVEESAANCFGWTAANHRCLGSLVIVGNPSLQSLAGLESLDHVDVELVIDDNRELGSLQGLASLQSVGGSVTISHMPALTDLEGPGQLATIDGGLMVHDNDRLQTLAGLHTLRTLGSDLVVARNVALTSLELPADMDFLGDAFTVRDNLNLPRQEACNLSVLWTGTDGCDSAESPSGVVFTICGNSNDPPVECSP